MSLNDDDIARIKVVVQEVLEPLRKEVEDVREDVRQVRQTVYGVEGTNGLSGTVKKHTEQLYSLLNSRAGLIGAVAAINFIAVLVIKLWP
jgi:hypothetical protein